MTFETAGLIVVLIVSIMGIIASFLLIRAADSIVRTVFGFLLAIAFIVILYIVASYLSGFDWRVF